MTRKISLILTGLMFLAFAGFAQDYTFRVMVSKGEKERAK
jgi:hypothetical protein